jgi:hypothetical protein
MLKGYILIIYSLFYLFLVFYAVEIVLSFITPIKPANYRHSLVVKRNNFNYCDNNNYFYVFR